MKKLSKTQARIMKRLCTVRLIHYHNTDEWAYPDSDKCEHRAISKSVERLHLKGYVYAPFMTKSRTEYVITDAGRKALAAYEAAHPSALPTTS